LVDAPETILPMPDPWSEPCPGGVLTL
jgi:hypothetical protein